MSKRLESKYKVNRRLGVNLWGRAKSPINKREYGPGQHGQRRKQKPSDFSVQLMAKQKLKFALTPFASRQFVNHGHVTVNGRKVNIPSFLVRDNDVVEVREKSKQLAVVLDAAQNAERDVPEYLEVDHRQMKGRFARSPKLTDVPYPVTMEPNLVVEFYSR